MLLHHTKGQLIIYSKSSYSLDVLRKYQIQAYNCFTNYVWKSVIAIAEDDNLGMDNCEDILRGSYEGLVSFRILSTNRSISFLIPTVYTAILLYSLFHIYIY